MNINVKKEKVLDISANLKKDFLKGDKGNPGPQGPPGQVGYTPIKGIDYWTEEDKRVIENYIDNYVADLEKTLQEILTIIQGGELSGNQVADIEQLIVSYFENKTVKEVEK